MHAIIQVIQNLNKNKQKNHINKKNKEKKQINLILRIKHKK